MTATAIGVRRPSPTPSRIRETYFSMDGGVDLSVAPNQATPGLLRNSMNYERDEDQGYRRIDGYERFDGQALPSSSTYSTLNFDSGLTEPTVGDTITGVDSGATGKLLTYVLESGSWGSDAAGYLVLGSTSGEFQDNESITIATVDGMLNINGANTPMLHNTYTGLAVEDQRAKIGPVPGIGPVRGVWTYNGDVYAYRDADASTAKKFKATTAGWVEQDLGHSWNSRTASGISIWSAMVTLPVIRSGPKVRAGPLQPGLPAVMVRRRLNHPSVRTWGLCRARTTGWCTRCPVLRRALLPPV